MKLRKLCLVAVFGFATSAFAGVGDGGCGLGSVLITKNSKLGQIGVMLINSVTGGVSFSMTTGTSNCKVDGIVSVDKETIYFVETNQSELSNEIAVGEGEKLDTLASMVGCEGAKDAFKQSLQSSYGEIFPNSNVSAAEMLQNVNTVVENDTVLAGQCTRS